MKTNTPLQNLVSRVADRLSLRNDSSALTEKSLRPLVIEALEPRILFSGSPAPAPEAAPAESPAVQESAAEPAPEASAPAAEGSAVAAPPAAAHSEEVAADAGTGDTAITLTDTELAALTEAASSIWASSGLTEEQVAALSSASYQIADLGGNVLGSAEGNLITIDDDAAGRGWFVDGTPDDDSEFASGGSATTGVDLLSVLLHEQGHLLGLDDSGAAAGDVMFEEIGSGERRLPGAGAADGAVAGSLYGSHFVTLAPATEDFEDEASGSDEFSDDAIPGGPVFTLAVGADQSAGAIFETFKDGSGLGSGGSNGLLDTFVSGNNLEAGDVGSITIESGWSFQVNSVDVAVTDGNGDPGGSQTVIFTGTVAGGSTTVTDSFLVDSDTSDYDTVDFTGSNFDGIQLTDLTVSLPASPTAGYLYLDNFSYTADDGNNGGGGGDLVLFRDDFGQTDATFNQNVQANSSLSGVVVASMPQAGSTYSTQGVLGGEDGNAIISVTSGNNTAFIPNFDFATNPEIVSAKAFTVTLEGVDPTDGSNWLALGVFDKGTLDAQNVTDPDLPLGALFRGDNGGNGGITVWSKGVSSTLTATTPGDPFDLAYEITNISGFGANNSFDYRILVNGTEVDSGTVTGADTTTNYIMVESWRGTSTVSALQVTVPVVIDAVDDVASTDEDTVLSVSAPGVFGNDSGLTGGAPIPITGVTIEDFSSENGGFGRFAVDSINGDGLSPDETTHNNVANDMWIDGPGTANNDGNHTGYITYDLEGNYDLDSVRVWNFNEVNLTNRAAKTVEISVASTVGGPFTSLGDFTLTQPPGTNGYTGELVDLSGFSAATDTRLIKFDIKENYGDDRHTGLAEVRFFEKAPTPASLSSFDALSAEGAAVTVNPNGSFTYDPTGSVSLQALNDGDTLDDTFTYTIAGEETAVIYEGFEYAAGGNLNGEDGGTGFAGAWDQTRNNPTVQLDSKDYGDLITTGNHVQGNAWSAMIRPIGSTLSDAGLMDNGSTLWFSVVMDLEGQNLTNADLNFALGTDQFEAGVFADRQNLIAGEAIGATHNRGTIQGVYWQNNDADSISERNTQNSSLVLNNTTNSRALIVGKIEWGATNAAGETLTLYAPGTDLDLGTEIVTMTTAALDQSQFDSVLLQFKDTPKMDEIRFGATTEDVLGPQTDTATVTVTVTGVTDASGSIDAIDDPSYEAAILADNPLGYFRLGEAAGATAAADASGNGNDLDYQNGAGANLGQPGAIPDGDTAATLVNGGTDQIQSPNTNDFGFASGESFSIEYWAKFEPGNSTANEAGLITKGYDAAQSQPWYLSRLNAAGTVDFYLRNSGGANKVATSSTVVEDGEWHHIVAVYDAAAAESRIYVDGTLEGTATGVAADAYGTNAGAFTVGNHLNRQVDGQIDEVAVYGEALTQAQIDAHLAATNPVETDEDTVLTVATPGVLGNDLGVGVGGGGLIGQLGILDLAANGGINPATGNLWEDGDTYRLVFVTSTTRNAVSTVIADYNDFAQTTAAAAGLGGATWSVIASTETVNARVNTSTVGSGGETIFLTDGSTVVANDYGDLWDGSLDAGINLDENGNLRNGVVVFTGTEFNSTTVADRWLGTTTISNNQLRVETGRSGDTGTRGWIRVFNAGPTSSQSFYAMSDVLTVNTAPPAGASITAFDAVSANGAAVTVNPDGGFSYDPTGSETIQALNDGDVLTDTFTYTIEASGTSTPAVILSTDFAGRTVSGSTASNISWVTNGIDDPGDLTAVETQEGDAGNQLAGLFDTTASGSHLAPDLNTDNEDNWSVAIPLTVTASSITIDDVVLDGDHFNNSGAFQGAGRDTDFVVSLTGSSSGVVATETKTTGNVTTNWGLTFFDTTAPINLDSSETWTLTIATTNFPNNSGNNTGLDGITVNGAVNTAPVTDTATVSVTVNGVDDGAVNDSYAGGAQVSIFTAGTAGEDVTTSDLVHDFDTTVRSAGTATLADNGSDIVLSAGHHLVIYNARFDKDPAGLGTEDRSEIQTNLNLAGTDLAAGWSQGYIRVQNNQNETVTAGGGIINVENNGDILHLESFRTDVDTNATTRADGATGIQLIKLDDTWDFLSLAGHDGSGSDQAIANTTTTWNDVVYNQENEVDSGSFGFTAGTGDITLNEEGHYLVFANTYGQGASSRTALLQRLTLDGVEVTGSKSSAYYRGNDINQLTDEGAASIGMIIETTGAGQTLNVQYLLDVGRNGMTIDGTRTGITIVKLPDDGDYIRLEDTSGDQNLNTGSVTALNYDDAGSQLEVDSAFTHSNSTNASRVGVTVDDDYLFLSGQFDNNDGAARGFYNQGWQVNGSGGLEDYGQTGRYTRNAGGADQFGNWSGFVTELQAGDYVESVTQALGAGGTNTADFLGLQGVRLSSLFPAANEDSVFTGTSILGNDNPAYGTLLGVNGTTSLTGTSTGGAEVTVNPDGTFEYDPTNAPDIQALAEGQSGTDTFTYTIVDDSGNDYAIDLLPGAARFDSNTDNDDAAGGFGAGAPGNVATGLTFQVTFTPVAGDLDSASEAVNLLEVGGDANGSGLYLLGGEVHFISKMNGGGGNVPVIGDLDMGSGNNMIGAKSSFGPLVAGTEYTVTAIFDPITNATLELVVDPADKAPNIDNFAIAGVGTKTNWNGDNSATALRAGNVGNFGGANTVGGNPFSEAAINANPFEGTAGQALYWDDHATGTVVVPAATPGFDFNADASLDTDGDNRWEDTVGTSGFDLNLDDSPAVNRVTVDSSATPGITAAYDFLGGSTGNEGGALLSIADTTTARSFQNVSGDWSNDDLTMEIWFKPDNISPTPANGQILFEDGGGTGLGFFIDNNELQLRKAPGGGIVSYNLDTDPSGLLLGAATDEFIQATATYDVSAGTMELFVNGVSVGTANPGGGDWSGGDAAGVGTRGAANTGGIGGGQSSTESFNGQIAIFRVYNNQILTEAEVGDNFVAVAPSTSTATVTITVDGRNDAPVIPTEVTVTTNTGTGGVSGQVRFGANETNSFGGTQFHVKNSGDTGTTTRKGYIRMDVSDIDFTVSDATLDLTVSREDIANNSLVQTIYVYGMTDESLDNWDPATATWTGAPANDTGSAYQADLSKAVLLGTFTYQGSEGVGVTKSLTGTALVDFLNADTNGQVTFILGRTGSSGGSNLLFAGDTHATLAPPTLTASPGSQTEGGITETTDNTDPADATGSIVFYDVDLTDTHTASVLGASVSGGTATLTPAQVAALLDNLGVSVTDDNPVDGEGTIDWTFTVPNSEIDFLASGETVEITHSVAVIEALADTGTLVAHYPLDAINAGTTADSAGSNGDGSVNGAVTLNASGGKIGGAFDFAAGSGNFVGVTDAGFGQEAFTASVWFKADSLNSGDPIANWTNAGSSPRTFLIRTNGGALQTFVRENGATQIGGSNTFATESLSTTEFNHAVITYDGQNLHTYLNGELSNEVRSFASPRSIGQGVQGTAAIGGRGSSEQNMDGLVDDVAFWEETLTDVKVKAIFNLADSALNYDAGEVNRLFQVFDESAVAALVGDLVWNRATGLGGSAGDVVDLGSGNFFVNLDGAAGVVSSLAATEDVIVTITGTNDGVVIDSPVQTGSITETADNTDPADATGTITFSDPDLADVPTAQVLPGGSVTGGTATLTTAQEAALLDNLSVGTVTDNPDGSGSVDWTYAVPNAETDFLAAGETVEVTQSVAVRDRSGADFETTSTGALANFASLAGIPSDESVSFEAVFQPSDLAGHEIIFETGGTNGSGMVLDDDTLIFRVMQNGSANQTAEVRYDLGTDALGVLPAPGDVSRAIHVLATFDLSTNGTATLSVNGIQVGTDTAPNSMTIWTGGNSGGFGTGNNALGGFGGTNVPFEGNTYGALDGTGSLFRISNGLVGVDVTEVTTTITGTNDAPEFSGEISVVNADSMVVADAGAPGPANLEANPSILSFDAGATADKLIVTVSSESSSSGPVSITYNGEALTPAIDGTGRFAGIWYLDNPFTGGPADLIVDMTNFGTVNGIGVGVVSISGSAPGFAAMASSGTDTVTINTTEPNSFVVSGHVSNGGGGVSADAPLTQIYASNNIGSARGSAGYANITDPGASTYSYSGTGPDDRTVVVAFAPKIAGANDFDPVVMDDLTNGGQMVSELIGTIWDVDNGAVEGIAITAASSSTAGTFQFSTDGGGTWTDVNPLGDPVVSVTNALLLRDTDMVRFLPNASGGGTETLTFKAWDQTGATEGQEGTKQTTLPDGSTNPDSAFSATTATANVDIVNVIIEDGVLIYGEGVGREDEVTISSDGSSVTIHDAAGPVLSGVAGAVQVDANTVEIDLDLFEDIVFRANDLDDTITVKDMEGFDGSLTILGEEDFDSVTFAAGMNLALGTGLSDGGADENLDVDAETVKIDFDASVSVVGDGTIDIAATGGGAEDFIGIQLKRASLTSADGAITLVGEGGSVGNHNDGVQINVGSTITTAGGSVGISGTGTGTSGPNDGVSLVGGSDVTVGGAGTITIEGTSSGAGDSNGVLLFSGTEVTTAGGDISVAGVSGGTGARNSGIYTNGATVAAGGAGSISLDGEGGGTGSHGKGLRLTASSFVASGTGDITLAGTGGPGTRSNVGVEVGVRTSLATGSGDVTVTGEGGGTASQNTGVAFLSGSSVDSGGGITVAGTGGDGTSNNDGVSLISATLEAAGDISVTGEGAGGGNYNRGIDSTRSSIGGAGVTLTGTGTQSGGTSARFGDGVYLNRGGASASGTLTIAATGGTGSSNNRGFYASGVTLGGTLAVTGTADAGTTGRGNSGVYILNSVLGAGTVEGTAGGGTGSFGAHMNNITGGLAPGDVTGNATDAEDELVGNFFNVLPALLLAAGADRRRKEQLSGLIAKLGGRRASEGEVEIYREEDGIIGLEAAVATLASLEAAGVEVPAAGGEARRMLVLTGGGEGQVTGVFASVDGAGKLVSTSSLKVRGELTASELMGSLEGGGRSEWSRVSRGTTPVAGRSFSEAFGIE